jgi:hypothetical protein
VLLESDHAQALSIRAAQPRFDFGAQHGFLLRIAPAAARDHEDFAAAAQPTRVQLAPEVPKRLQGRETMEIDLERLFLRIFSRLYWADHRVIL